MLIKNDVILILFLIVLLWGMDQVVVEPLKSYKMPIWHEIFKSGLFSSHIYGMNIYCKASKAALPCYKRYLLEWIFWGPPAVYWIIPLEWIFLKTV